MAFPLDNTTELQIISVFAAGGGTQCIASFLAQFDTVYMHPRSRNLMAHDVLTCEMARLRCC